MNAAPTRVGGDIGLSTDWSDKQEVWHVWQGSSATKGGPCGETEFKIHRRRSPPQGWSAVAESVFLPTSQLTTLVYMWAAAWMKPLHNRVIFSSTTTQMHFKCLQKKGSTHFFLHINKSHSEKFCACATKNWIYVPCVSPRCVSSTKPTIVLLFCFQPK